MNRPTELNGYPVIEITQHDNGYSTVMCDRGKDGFAVATWWPPLGATWSWGHYSFDLIDARRDYRDVCARNAARGSAL